jgi:hypothetical protein
LLENWDDVRKTQGISILRIQKQQGAVTIIDGQHRAAALDAAQAGFQVLVTLFIDLDIVHCAEIFAMINSTQKAVNPSIAFQLFGYSPDRSPQRTAHDIATLLNTKDGSPFFRRLRMLGTKDDWSLGTSVATLQASSWDSTPETPGKMRTGCPRDGLQDYSSTPSGSLYPWRRRHNTHDGVVQLRVAETWPDQWSERTSSPCLKTTGYAALVEVLRRCQFPRSAQVLATTASGSLFQIRATT